MIIKHITRRRRGASRGAGGFGRVVRYILREGVRGKGEGEGVRGYGIVGCVAETERLQRLEMAAVIEQNQGAKGERYYHVIVSLQQGETLSTKAWEEIAGRVAKEIGFAEHQRVYAIHTDTEHEHLHVVFSKIHPERYTLHEPFRAYKKFRELVRECEADYSLQPSTDHKKQQTRRGSNGEMEAHRAEESLLSWLIKEKGQELFHSIKSGAWESVQKTLHECGLTVQERGRGFVVADPSSGAMIKFSDLSKALSLRDEAKQLAGFNPALSLPTDPSMPSPSSSYRWTSTSPEAERLRRDFERDRRDRLTARHNLVSLLKEEQAKAVAAARLRYRGSGDGAEVEHVAIEKQKRKTHRLRSAVNRYLSVKARVDLYYRRRRRGVYLRTRVKSWKEYLIERSSHDPLALTVLREEEARRLGRGGVERKEARHERGRVERRSALSL
jgi:hypothetical protein